MEVTLYGRDTVVMAIDPTGGLGGLAVIPAKGPGGPIQIEVAPLVEVRGRFTCEESGQPPGETYATMFLGPRLHAGGRRPLARLDVCDEAAAGTVPAPRRRELSPRRGHARSHARAGPAGRPRGH